jgi:uncharacterized protein (DUF1697 family)
MKTLVALLRGINVGGKNKIAMSELRSSLSSLGLQDVATYIQSGNVVFRSPDRADDLAGDIEQRIAGDFGVSVTVLLRTASDLQAVGRSNPFLKGGADHSKLHVVFLSDRPAANAVAGLDPERSPPDQFSLLGREIYLHLPNGSGRSKLTIDYFERRLGVAATARNWNTLIKLIALTQP